MDPGVGIVHVAVLVVCIVLLQDVLPYWLWYGILSFEPFPSRAAVLRKLATPFKWLLMGAAMIWLTYLTLCHPFNKAHLPLASICSLILFVQTAPITAWSVRCTELIGFLCLSILYTQHCIIVEGEPSIDDFSWCVEADNLKYWINQARIIRGKFWRITVRCVSRNWKWGGSSIRRIDRPCFCFTVCLITMLWTSDR